MVVIYWLGGERSSRDRVGGAFGILVDCFDYFKKKKSEKNQ